ncbi:Oidioi.mRNA.OKI2018_I69.chr2.g4349.t1.cds [Oikopleura dioica]|uniref:Oidioi.mRNA.OKI2018_I69.chr2.g4349.t1.cds n=1 Tax=Oikopleura dioica TaxID=34765 RepID=A0ABN7T1B6_OIKDI|nr:Oidioi.mRNA.OKI2018_I69.chr2.g4349.t1.cds [Oikopleura dioica]
MLKILYLLSFSFANSEVCELFEWIKTEQRSYILAEIGSKLEIDCTSSWGKGEIFKSGVEEKINHEVLQIENLELHHFGEYICRAECGGVVKWKSIKVERQKRFFRRPDVQIGYKLVSKEGENFTNTFIKEDLVPAYNNDNGLYWTNQTVILVCVVFADPLPYINFNVSSNGKLKTGSFIAKNVVYTWNLYEKTDKIFFNCSASNAFGMTFNGGMLYRIQSFQEILVEFIPVWLPPLTLFAFAFCLFFDGWRRYQNVFKYELVPLKQENFHLRRVGYWFGSIPPYAKIYNSSSIELVEIIDEGFFGSVFLAILEKKRKCVVKMSKEEEGNLLEEINLMCRISDHGNIVQLIGVFVDSQDKRSKGLPLPVLEHALYGNLRCFLRFQRGLIDNTKSQLPKISIKPPFLHQKALEIAQGMAHLQKFKIVHGDLAARNVLVFEDLTVKISDFGMSKKLSQNYYRKTSKGMLPFKWMAPESLRDAIFTEKSDVWSFGITIWEIFTLGETPYAALTADEILPHLNSGSRLEILENMPRDLLESCWQKNLVDRPSFEEILDIYLTQI